ncbi:2-amino-4-hydroxy-6-hydroxymethyldihydropteridine diphosphokinase [Caloramator sp. Dgby_cultured_2]|uniref:2-amino-4-hydroxy-6- hydroxymethyldihydropteridine diphosphokinase n=1 Tax=Caloramator sp. Dgby_cultured_2 TaxID=3029174 RepID=UPI00237E9506|nr:2-amino-4-hydroxy-6-hydroxymethyldihydropteridine diphosphokinase [Caloramator sp. Dgby_cultured_2]WDU83672.1 2-amino-4-hydroxy-6-hydroxymethyldihydropteridine diphosphokinase [Caloramator sp. Dgby_cultured_2]
MNLAYIAFGTNVGDREENINVALKMMEDRGIKIIKTSKIYVTEPYGYKDQPEFLNGAVEVETNLSCRELLNVLLNIEKDMGRVRHFKWGPRNIDLDIIFYNDEVIDEPDLKVPHPDMHNRDFVLKPLCDLNPNFVHPILKKPSRLF